MQNREEIAEAGQLLEWIREEATPAHDDDPLQSPLITRFWNKGQVGSALSLRQAAAALLATDKTTADAVPILEEGLRSHDYKDSEGAQLALAVAYLNLKQFEKLSTTAEAIYAKWPRSDAAFRWIATAQIGLGHRDKLEKLTQTRLQTHPRDATAVRFRLTAAVKRVDLEAGRQQENMLRQWGKLETVDLNNVAWLALLAGRVDQTAIQTIQEAILRSQEHPDPSTLHTAASLYAEAEKSTAARDVLLQSLELRGLDEPDPDSWYVFGRIAETYDQIDAAREMFARVRKPERPVDMPDSVYVLAQQRLARLGTEHPSN